MRKLLATMTMFGMMMSSTGFAGDSAKWAKYKELKSVVGNSVTETVKAKLATAEFAEQNLEDKSIAGWSYNNAGYVLIQEFKEKTDYDAATSAIFNAETGKRKQKRADLRASFSENLALLTEAEGYLDKSKAVTNDEKVLAKVSSNRAFIEWVKGFIDSKD